MCVCVCARMRMYVFKHVLSLLEREKYFRRGIPVLLHTANFRYLQ